MTLKEIMGITHVEELNNFPIGKTICIPRNGLRGIYAGDIQMELGQGKGIGIFPIILKTLKVENNVIYGEVVEEKGDNLYLHKIKFFQGESNFEKYNLILNKNLREELIN